MRPIAEIAEKVGLDTNAIIPQGHYKAKLPLDLIREGGPRGKMILVTGITPTQAGEGKTTTAVGLTDGLGKLGKSVCVNLREPSLGPIFGIKGGGTGGGKAVIEPLDEINVHFTGDAHAVASAHNLLGAFTENEARLGNVDGLTPDGITWRRVMDIEDRGLRQIISGLGGAANAPLRSAGFDIVTASEVMAILALSRDLDDLRERLSRAVVAFTTDGQPVTANDVDAVGSMMSLLRYAIQPNLVQTGDGQAATVHTGPFGNIAHGCSSVVGDRMMLGYVDYVVTEAGFGADLGFEKFMDIKARFNGLEPSAVVIVATVRALKSHGGVPRRELDEPNEAAVEAGLSNLEHLIRMIKSYGLTVVVALNSFPTDRPNEVTLARRRAEAAGAHSAPLANHFALGGDGAVELAEAVVDAAEDGPPAEVTYPYTVEDTVEDKVLKLAQTVYNAKDVSWAPAARRQLRRYENLGWGGLPVCMAKTHLSISHNRRLLGCPSDYTFEINDVRASVGAGFIYPIAGDIVTMPGLPSRPRKLDVDAHGNITGL